MLVAVLAAGSLPVSAAIAMPPAAPVLMAGEPVLEANLPVTPTGAPGITPGDLDGADAAAGQHPSVAYEEAMAHANDKIKFEPGGKVEVGFTPRAGDNWPVDGRAPSALPPGRATGRQMAASEQGTAWTDMDAAPLPSAAPASPVPDPALPAPDPAELRADPASPAPESSDAPVDAPAGDPGAPATGAGFVAPEVTADFDLAAASGLRRQVFGFLPYWELSGASSKLNFDTLSTIAYFSVGADSKGNLRKKDSDGTNTTGWGGWTS